MYFGGYTIDKFEFQKATIFNRMGSSGSKKRSDQRPYIFTQSSIIEQSNMTPPPHRNQTDFRARGSSKDLHFNTTLIIPSSSARTNHHERNIPEYEFNETVTTPSSSDRADFSKRNSSESIDLKRTSTIPLPIDRIDYLKKPKDHCQVCGIESATIHCHGPRCYTFFCTECDNLYHQHPRRMDHKRGDISTYTPKENQIASSNAVLTDQLMNKVDQFGSANTFNTHYVKKIESKAESSDGTAWICKHCTFVNQISNRICQVCCKTNPKILAGRNVSEVEPTLETLANSTTMLTNQSKKEEGTNSNNDNKLYNQYWFKENNSKSQYSPSSSSMSLKSNASNPSDIRTYNIIARDRSSGNQNRDIPLDLNKTEKIIKTQEKFDAEVTKPLPSADAAWSTIWCCKFCYRKNESIFYSCQFCGTSKKQYDSKLNTPNKVPGSSELSTKQNDVIIAKVDVAASRLEDSAEIDVIALDFMQNNHIEDYEVAKLASKLVKQNFKLHDAFEAAKKCNNLDDALAYLDQDCPMCLEKVLSHARIQMVHCTHRICVNCTRSHFSRQIWKNDITSFVCPVCKMPDLSELVAFTDDVSKYFTSLIDMLKPIIEARDHEMYQVKLKEWFLRRHPNFIKCPGCLYENIEEGQRFNRVICPKCKKMICTKCKQIICISLHNCSAKLTSYVSNHNSGARSTSAARVQTTEQQRGATSASAAALQLNTHRMHDLPLPNEQSQQSTGVFSHNLLNPDNTSDFYSNRNISSNLGQFPSPGNFVGSYPGAVDNNKSNAYKRLSENNTPSDLGAGNLTRIVQAGNLPPNSTPTITYGQASIASNIRNLSRESAGYSTSSTEWMCNGCGFKNETSRKRCMICNRSNAINLFV